MNSIQKDMEEFQGQLRRGSIQRAYRTLLSCMMGLRTHFKNKYPDASVSAIYQGVMDMTYFAILTPSLKKRDLKIAIVFNYEAFRFEAWLAGRNRSVSRRYWELLKDRKWPSYRVITPAKGVDSIIECDLTHGFDLSDTNPLTIIIEKGARTFIEDIEAALAKGKTT
ncbi:MAG: hypothetical protein JW932_04375 [Deltaproteobacteria bacterium]|nr:hypothetical protein [Deltaproteobacteria bacterium]